MKRTVFCFVAAWVSCRNAPVDGVWPPEPGASAYRISVSVDAWHAALSIPDEQGRPEEWGYAEMDWYFGGKQGCFGAIRAIGWPTAGVIENVREPRRFLVHRSSQPPVHTWEFDLSEEGLRRLRGFVRKTRADQPFLDEGWRRWYEAADDYWLGHTCHTWAARALREAGLPVSPGFSITQPGIEGELNYVLWWLDRHGLKKSAARD